MSEPTANLSAKLTLWLATGFGAGYARVMPGTVGAMWGIPLALAIFSLPGVLWQLLAMVLLVIIGVPLCGRAAQALGKHDPGAVVWDEFATVPMAFFLLDPNLVHNPWVLLAGFLLHRLFDITKLFPANRCEAFPGGFGIMADDCVAGAYACISLHVLIAVGNALSHSLGTG